MPTLATTIEVEGREIRVSNPDKVLFPEIGVTKMELVEYYLMVADAALIGCRDRPTIMHRFPNGVDGEPFYQKRVPTQRPPWVQTATISFPSGRHAEMIAPTDAAHLAWMANLACFDVNPWPVRRDDVDHPDELRVDLDPTPGVPWDDVRHVTLVVRDVLEEHGAVGFPATSGKRGMHLVVPIVREHGFTTVRRAALALAREVTRRAPGVATAAWWKEERQGRVRRLQPERARPDRGVRLLSATGAGRAGGDATHLGRGTRRGSVALHDPDGAGSLGVDR